jgi:hypothetical protein
LRLEKVGQAASAFVAKNIFLMAGLMVETAVMEAASTFKAKRV